jgi:Uma2 family endonuclease
MFLADGVRFTNTEAEFSLRPDGLFVGRQSIEDKDVVFVEGLEEGYLEIEGSPDMVLEVVSTSSVVKDTERLREAYWRAGVREYWLVDARSEPVKFDVLRHTARGYSAARRQDGWVRSGVFGKSFRLTTRKTPEGHPDFLLEVR